MTEFEFCDLGCGRLRLVTGAGPKLGWGTLGCWEPEVLTELGDGEWCFAASVWTVKKVLLYCQKGLFCWLSVLSTVHSDVWCWGWSEYWQGVFGSWWLCLSFNIRNLSGSERSVWKGQWPSNAENGRREFWGRCKAYLKTIRMFVVLKTCFHRVV